MHDDLGARLIQAGLVTREQLAEVLGAAPPHEGALVAALVRRGLSEDALAGFFLASGFGPLMAGHDLDGAAREAIEKLPPELACELLAFPVKESAAGLVVAMAAPTDRHALGEIGRTVRAKILPTVARVGELTRALSRAYPGGVIATHDARVSDSEPPVLELVRRTSGSYLGSTRGADRVEARALVGPRLVAEEDEEVVPLVRHKPVAAADAKKKIVTRSFEKPREFRSDVPLSIPPKEGGEWKRGPSSAPPPAMEEPKTIPPKKRVSRPPPAAESKRKTIPPERKRASQPPAAPSKRKSIPPQKAIVPSKTKTLAPPPPSQPETKPGAKATRATIPPSAAKTRGSLAPPKLPAEAKPDSIDDAEIVPGPEVTLPSAPEPMPERAPSRPVEMRAPKPGPRTSKPTELESAIASAHVSERARADEKPKSVVPRPTPAKKPSVAPRPEKPASAAPKKTPSIAPKKIESPASKSIAPKKIESLTPANKLQSIAPKKIESLAPVKIESAPPADLAHKPKSIIPPEHASWELDGEPDNKVDPGKLRSIGSSSPPKRTLRPAPIGGTLAAIRASRERDEIADLACRGALTVCRAAILLAFRKNVLKGWDGAGVNISRDAVRNLWIPTNSPSMFRDVVAKNEPYVGQHGTSAADGLFRAAVGSRGGEVVLHPIAVGGRVIAVLAGADVEYEREGRDRIEVLARALGEAFERVITSAKNR
jgi:hypothetical protein